MATDRPGAQRPPGEKLQGERQGGALDNRQDRREQRHEAHRQSTYRSFIKDLAAFGGFDVQDAERYTISVLCALEQRLYSSEVKDLEAQLPVILQDLLQRCARHQGPPPQKFGKQEFCQMIADDLGMDVNAVDPIVKSVFAAVRTKISVGEAEDVASMLPKDLQELWRQPV